MLGTRTAWFPTDKCPVAIDSVWPTEESWKEELREMKIRKDSDFEFLNNQSDDTKHMLMTMRRTRIFGGRSYQQLLPLAQTCRLEKVERGKFFFFFF